MLTFGSLFAGIGGFDLGFERAGLKCEWQVEKDNYCWNVLFEKWPNVPKWDDVNTFPPDHSTQWNVDVICGGFPCQDISNAGDRAGIDGQRSGLWHQYARIIRALRPSYVVVENVAALLDRGIARVLGDLAASGFDAAWEVLSACAFGAPHVRRRLFIVAYANGVDGRKRLRNPLAQQDWSLQTIDGAPRARAGWKTRLENPSALYGNINGIAHRSHRNRAIGNAVIPDIAEWIGRQIVSAHTPAAEGAGT